MFKRFFKLLLMVLFILLVERGITHATLDNTSETGKTKAIETYLNLPLQFIANDGQLDEKIKFYEKATEHSTFFAKEGVYINLSAGETIQKIKLTPINGNRNPDIFGEGLLKGTVNSFVGKEKKNWKTNISTYHAVMYRNIYENIDVRFYGNNRQLEYDMIVKPGADPSIIKFSYEGINKLSITNEGNLLVEVDGNELTHKNPYIYQEINGKRKEINGEFKLYDNNSFGFQLASYDKNHTLIIDPVIIYSTHLGGRHIENGKGIAIDAAGNIYVTGRTQSSDFPTFNALQPNTAPFGDIFVSKINSSGDAFVYSTYLGGTDGPHGGPGGSSYEIGESIAVDNSGNAYITGATDSRDFPLQNAFQQVLGGETDAFVTKISPAGDALIYSTYLGGIGNDYGNDIAIDGEGNAYVAGFAGPHSFPTKNPIESTGTIKTAFVTKINPSGNALIYSSIFGGNSHSATFHSIDVDSSQNVYIAGETGAPDFPVYNAIQPNYGGGQTDVILMKINSSGDRVIYSTYIGGSIDDSCYDSTIDGAGNVYLTGATNSGDFPIVHAFQPNFVGVSFYSDAFITKINSNGDALVYSSYLGGGFFDIGDGIAVDRSGYIYISGRTTSNNFPTQGTLIAPYMGGWDGFVTILSPAGDNLRYSSYLGMDYAWDIAVDDLNNIYTIGEAGRILTVNAIQPYNRGYSDAFIMKIGVGDVVNQPPLANAGTDQTLSCTGSEGAVVTLDGSQSSDPNGDTLTYTWTGSFGTVIGISPTVILPLGTHTVTLSIDDGKGGTAEDIALITVKDITPSSTTVTISGIPGNNGWYVSDVTVALFATDNCSGVKELHYVLDEVETVVPGIATGILISSDGEHNLSYWSVDNAGNVESAHTITINIDTIKPVVTLTATPNILWPPNHKMVDVIIGGTALDNLSGIANIIFTVTDEYGTVEPTITGFGTTIQLEASRSGKDINGRLYTITVNVADNAGNSYTASTIVMVPHDHEDADDADENNSNADNHEDDNNHNGNSNENSNGNQH